MEETQVLIRPIISEKSSNLAASGLYTFAVTLGARKPEIKKAVEETFAVNVLAVRTMVVKGKKVRVGRRLLTVKKSPWKKAIVELSAGEKIDLFSLPSGGQEGKK